MIDTHCHLYDEAYNEDLDGVMSRAKSNNITKIILPCINNKDIKSILGLCSEYSGVCHGMIGLHPCDVNENYSKSLDAMKPFLSNSNIVAIGEVGLDFFRDKSKKELQEKAFIRQLDWVRQYKLPVVLHVRNAHNEVLSILRKYKDEGYFDELISSGIIHCFTESYEIAEEYIKLGFYLGIGGVITFKNSNLKETLYKIPLEKIVLETDGPYLSPVPKRGKRNEPSYLKYVCEVLTDIYKVSKEEIIKTTSKNSIKVFNL